MLVRKKVYWQGALEHSYYKEIIGSSAPEVFLGKGVLKIYSKFTVEHPCRSVISIKLLCNFIEITLRHGCSPVNLLHIFRRGPTSNFASYINRINQLQLLLKHDLFCLISISLEKLINSYYPGNQEKTCYLNWNRR